MMVRDREQIWPEARIGYLAGYSCENDRYPRNLLLGDR
jgi:hypothetical protein